MRFREPLVDDFGGVLGFGRGRLGGQWWHTGRLRVGVGDLVAQARAAQHQREAITLARLDLALHAVDLDVLEQFDPLLAFFGRDASGAAVGDVAVGVDGAEVAAHRHVAAAHVQADANRFEHAAPDVVDQRVVAEQREVRRTAARGDAARDRDAQAGAALAGEAVEVGGLGGFQFGQAAGRHRQAAQSVHDQQQNLAAILFGQAAHQIKVCHVELLAYRVLSTEC